MEETWKKTKDVQLPCGLTVKVRFIGTPEDPFRWDDLYTEFSAAQERAYANARKKLIKDFGSMADAVASTQESMRELGLAEEMVQQFNARALLSRTVSNGKEAAAWVKACIVEGCEYDGKTGLDAYESIYNARGSAGISEAGAAVRSYNTVGPQVGEG
jgi:hypothetical protein